MHIKNVKKTWTELAFRNVRRLYQLGGGRMFETLHLSQMNGQRFVYDDSLVELCSLENDASPERGACSILFRLHSTHYHGRELIHEYPARFQAFVKNVRIVHHHNHRRDVSHRITLNQFSDVPIHGLPFSSSVNNSLGNRLDRLGQGDHVFVRLDMDDFLHIMDVDENHLRPKKQKRVDPNIVLSSRDMQFIVDKTLYSRVKKKAKKQHQTTQTDDNTSGYTPMYNSGFDVHLNWASTDNPDGVSIVHPPIDQGSCGSCWAFAATGTLEASASRTVAFEVYKNYLLDNDGDDAEAKANAAAQIAEREALFVASLSVQELVDCDTAVDQGCTGGNPLLAFSFIHRYGLTNSRDYPYLGHEDKCHFRKVANPIATTQSWGILTTDHEDNMEMAIRWVGPLAVGISGSDPTFLAYKEGIYFKDDCDQEANHAVLIVGYGQEEHDNGSVVRYWVARNSWGVTWGENGFVKIKRGSGAKSEPGVCGIAKNPSVALGGVLLPKSGIHTANKFNQTSTTNRSQPLEDLQESLFNNYCSALGGQDLKTCHKIEGFFQSYPALTYGVFSVFAVLVCVVWPLTRDCRARSRRREIRRRHNLQNDNTLEIDIVQSESDCLLASMETLGHSYGTARNIGRT